jgi:hypothetical protein
MKQEEILAEARRQATEDFLKRTPDGQRMTNLAAGEPWKPTAFDMEAQQHQTTLAPGPEEPEDGGVMQDIGHMAKAGVIPGVTAAMGTAAGAALPIPGGAVMGGMLGSGAGEKINQMLGITEPSDMAVYANTAAPLVGRGLAAGFGSMKRNAMRLIPGSGAAIHEMAAETAAGIPGQVGPSRTIQGVMKLIESKNPGRDTSAVQQAIGAKLVNLADPNTKVSQLLYETADELAKQAGGPIRIESNHVKSAVAKLLDKEAKMGAKTASPEIRALAEEFDGLAKNGTGIPFDVLYARLQRLNGQVGGAKGEDLGAYKLLIGAIENDINHTVAAASDQIPAAQAFRTAQAAWKQEKGQAAVQDLVTRATTARGSDELVTFNRGVITKALSNDKDLQKLLGPKAVAFIKDELSGIGIIPALPPPPGAHFGSGRNVIGTGAGFVAGLIQTSNPMMAAAVGASVPVAMEIISKAAMTETGRTMIKHFAKAGKGKIGPAAISILSAYVEGGTHILDGAAEMAVGE